MDTLTQSPYGVAMEHTQTLSTPIHPEPLEVAGAAVIEAIRKRSFATLATTSSEGRPHAAGVLYALSDSKLYVSTMLSSRKARNILDNPRVAVTIPVRRAPVGPPSSIIFQASARVLDLDDPGLRTAAATGELKAVTGHGEPELPGGCFVEIALPRRAVTYGLGMSLLSLIRDPMNAAGVATLG